MGSEDTENPEYQVGEGCLVDQLIGQYLAEVAGLGPLLDPRNIRTALESIHRYNSRPSLVAHECVERTYALNDESALIVCDYTKPQRPRIPFPYYAEAWTGLEYPAAAHMLYAGMIREGLECVRNSRARYDGEKRNPWDEAECGHHYARAMSAWSVLLAAQRLSIRRPNCLGGGCSPPRRRPVPMLLVDRDRLGHFFLLPDRGRRVVNAQRSGR